MQSVVMSHDARDNGIQHNDFQHRGTQHNNKFSTTLRITVLHTKCCYHGQTQTQFLILETENSAQTTFKFCSLDIWLLSCYAECHVFWVSHITPWCWVSSFILSIANKPTMLSGIKLNVIMLSYFHIECHYALRHYAQCHYAECHICRVSFIPYCGK
jgi:hypothetical protein